MFAGLSLKAKIYLGISLLTTMVVIVGLVGLGSVNKLSQDLSYIVGPAWSTADGAMEGTIEIQKQLIEVHDILAGNNREAGIEIIKEAKQAAEGAFARVFESGLIAASELATLKPLIDAYNDAMDQLLARFHDYSESLAAFNTHTEAFVKLGQALEEIGDGAVEEVEKNPEMMISWNGGLDKKWAAADGGMESGIGHLRQLYHLQRLLSGESYTEQWSAVQSAEAFQNEAMTAMLSTGHFDGPVDAAFGKGTWADAYRNSFSNHQTLLTDLVKKYQEFTLGVSRYEVAATQLFDKLVVIEGQGDHAVDGKKEAIEKNQQFSETLMLITLLLGLLLGLATAYLLQRMFVLPIKVLQNRMADIADGEGDLTRRLTSSRKDEIGLLANAFDRFVDKIHKLVSQTAENIENLRVSATRLAEFSSVTAVSMQSQKTETDGMVAAVAELAATARDVSENAHNASAAVKQAEQNGEEGRTVLFATAKTVETLAANIEKGVGVINSLKSDVGNIVSVLDVIRSIAEQTNLLALNAAIEAARAGDQGRGFAVVADEVRALAKRTQDSTAEIQQMINALQNSATQAVDIMNLSQLQGTQSQQETLAARDSIESALRALETIVRMNEQIASVTTQQSAVTSDVENSISHIQSLSDNTLQQVRDTEIASEQIRSIGTNLHDIVKRFRI